MLEHSSNKKLFWPILWALALHLCLFTLLFVSFSKTPELPPVRPIVKATLYQLQSQNKASSQTTQKIAGEADKTAAKQHEREQLEQKKHKEQEAAARKAEEERQANAQKAAEQKKRAAEKKAAEQRKLEQQKAEAAKRAAQKAKAEAEQKRAAEQKKKNEELARAEQKKKAAELAARKAAEKAREAARKAEEERKAAALAELLQNETQYQRDMADKQSDQEVAHINDLLRQLVSSHWIRPGGARNGMLVEVTIHFLPDGTIRQAVVSKSSGNQAFDNSAIAAIHSVGRVREIQNLPRATYEKTYRLLIVTFKPEDLSL